MTFIRTSPFFANDKQHSAYQTIPLLAPTNDTAHNTKVACAIVRHIRKQGHQACWL